MPSPYSIDRTWLQQLASVAGLNLPPERAARLRPRLEQLLAIVDQLPAPPPPEANVADAVPPAAHTPGRTEPGPTPCPAAAVAAVMAERDHDGWFLVPRRGNA